MQWVLEQVGLIKLILVTSLGTANDPAGLLQLGRCPAEVVCCCAIHSAGLSSKAWCMQKCFE